MIKLVQLYKNNRPVKVESAKVGYYLELGFTRELVEAKPVEPPKEEVKPKRRKPVEEVAEVVVEAPVEEPKKEALDFNLGLLQ